MPWSFLEGSQPSPTVCALALWRWRSVSAEPPARAAARLHRRGGIGPVSSRHPARQPSRVSGSVHRPLRVLFGFRFLPQPFLPPAHSPEPMRLPGLSLGPGRDFPTLPLRVQTWAPSARSGGLDVTAALPGHKPWSAEPACPPPTGGSGPAAAPRGPAALPDRPASSSPWTPGTRGFPLFLKISALRPVPISRSAHGSRCSGRQRGSRKREGLRSRVGRQNASGRLAKPGGKHRGPATPGPPGLRVQILQRKRSRPSGPVFLLSHLLTRVLHGTRAQGGSGTLPLRGRGVELGATFRGGGRW